MKYLLLFLLVFPGFSKGHAQVGINTITPESSSSLDVSATDKGVLIPRVSLSDVNNTMIDGVNTAATSLLIFNTNASVTGGSGEGFYYFNGTTWVKLVTYEESVDADWHEESTTSNPGDINDDIYTYGNVAIGKNTADYPLDISLSDNSSTRTLNLNTISNNTLQRDGINNQMNATGSGDVKGLNNTISGTSDGNQVGTYNLFSNNGNGSQYGTLNLFFGQGQGWQYGSYTSIFGGNGNGWHVGAYHSITGTSTNVNYGVYNALSSTAGSGQAGTWNTLGGNGGGSQIGTYNRISNDGSTGDHFGTYNTLAGTTNSNMYAVYNYLDGFASGTGNKYGIFNYLSLNVSGTHYGIYADVRKSGSFSGYFIGNFLVDVDNDQTNNNGLLFVDTDNNLIGIGTESPSYKLDVNGTIRAADVNFSGLPTYADEAAAGVGGLLAGDMYKTATGELRIKL